VATQKESKRIPTPGEGQPNGGAEKGSRISKEVLPDHDFNGNEKDYYTQPTTQKLGANWGSLFSDERGGVARVGSILRQIPVVQRGKGGKK